MDTAVSQAKSRFPAHCGLVMGIKYSTFYDEKNVEITHSIIPVCPSVFILINKLDLKSKKGNGEK